MNKFNEITCMACYIVYFLLWIFIVISNYIGYSIGAYTCFEDLLGTWSLYLFAIFAFAFFISPVFLQKIIQKQWITAVLSIIVAIVFMILSTFIVNMVKMQFSEFSQDKWTKYPRQRYLMVNDLEKHQDIIGISKSDVEKILGTPDLAQNNGLGYSSGRKYIVVWVWSDKVRSISVHDGEIP